MNSDVLTVRDTSCDENATSPHLLYIYIYISEGASGVGVKVRVGG